MSTKLMTFTSVDVAAFDYSSAIRAVQTKVSSEHEIIQKQRNQGQQMYILTSSVVTESRKTS